MTYKPENITIFGRVLFINPDKREYMQGSMKVIPSPKLESTKAMDEMVALHIAVDIPFEKEYVANYSKFISTESILSEIGHTKDVDSQEDRRLPDPILTVKGLKYLRDKYQEEFKDEEEKEELLTDLDDEDIDWSIGE